MAQIFHRSTNFIARFSVFSTLFLVGVALVAVLTVARSPYMTRQNVTREQPVQFSHKHHVGDDGIDCRYCHTGVETSAVAGIPPTKTCMNCHAVLREKREDVFSMDWTPPPNQAEIGKRLALERNIRTTAELTSCSTCHR